MRCARALLLLALAVVGGAGCTDDDSNDDDNPTVPECDPGSPITVTFDDQGTFQTASLMLGGLTITGSSAVQVLNLNGLGVVGGVNDNVVDGSEFLRFSIDADAATDVSYFVVAGGNLDGDALQAESTIEAFDLDSASLGVVAVDDTGTKNVSARFGGEPISAFVVRANVDSLRIDRVVYTPCL